MLGPSHYLLTKVAFDLLYSQAPKLPLHMAAENIAKAAEKVDDKNDLELVDVEVKRDDPHDNSDSSFLDKEDIPGYVAINGFKYTALNHFIDIRKGSGQFDDFDGYSYQKGSASREEFEFASEEADKIGDKFLTFISGKKVDEGINWYYNDSYVHVQAQPWYRGCSPSTERYSFPADKRIYSSMRDELGARFPLADNMGAKGKGTPYSVFMPVDNMARYWFAEYLRGRGPDSLGYVMHAIQDASIPHHAAGCCGNWHGTYEKKLDSYLHYWLNEAAFRDEVTKLFRQWYKDDSSQPTAISVNDWNKLPAKNWRTDFLVTWLALNSYKEYAGTYNNFRNGFKFDEGSAKNLVKLALTMSMLFLAKAANYAPSGGEVLSRELTANTLVHDFETVQQGKFADYLFKITNTGNAEISIKSIIPPKTSAFQVTQPSLPLILKPGQSFNINTRFAPITPLVNVFGKPFPLNLNAKLSFFDDQINIYSNATNFPQLVLHVKGMGISKLK